MKQLHGNSLILGAGAMIFLAAQPVWAQITQITDVQLNPVDGGISVVLKTNSGNRPQVFTTKRGKALVADIINTQLRLSQGNDFRQDNPAPGIASVAIAQLDPNSIRVVVTGIDSAPTSQPVVRKQDSIALGFTSTQTGKMPTPQTPQAAAPPSEADKMPSPQTPQTAAQAPTPSQPSQKPNVLVPNPKVSIDGKPAPLAGPGQPMTSAPPFLPRAVAPPVGDIAISNLDASPTTIDLGSQERVPRLVLRDAPVREVLSLLARAAGLNLAYTGSGGDAPKAGAGDGPTISLDIENEPVQDVFNYVLRLSGLEANRSGRTVFVGPNLPNGTRDVVMRNLRLNQVTVGVALNFLVGLGAESAVSRERQVTSVSAVPVGSAANAVTQTQTTTETQIQRLSLDDSKYTKPLLRGLQALGDERTNSITLIGTPRLVEMAMAQITQLDIRRRQVAVNVRIIDVNLSGTQDFNSSFSFGIGNNYFSNDGGAATLNFGGSRPATGAEVTGSVTSTPVITNPITGTPFVDPNQVTTLPGAGSGTTIVNQSSNPVTLNGITVQPNSIGRTANTDTTTPKPISPASSNPLTPGFTNITRGTNDIITIDSTGKTSVSQGTVSTVTSALSSLYQFPKRFLASLQAQVQNGNAKILTDPTLIVQEGQTANVNLTEEVVGNITNQITRGTGDTTQVVTANKTNVGLTVAVKVERIDDNGFVSLSVAPDVKAPQASVSLNLGQGSSQTITLVSDRSLQSGLIRLRDGQTLILSGIIQDTDRTTVSKIPILGDIPLLGSLFRKTNRQNQRQEVIVLLTPQILDDSERSSFGYNYNPSPEVRQILERRGLQAPRKR
ncbi:MAG: AMIN domain-containing protein [Stigonema ocellatum SAG 48.90 = DSM 106950]|nr:AMIN domain-containing protein [Stigonema ocellatum SAG 48.90 = DSM 106950]